MAQWEQTAIRVLFVPLAEALAIPRQLTRQGLSRFRIYAIVGPDDCVRYVGKTTMQPAARLAWHMSEPTNRAMRDWIHDLKKWGQRARIVTLEYVSREEWQDAERGWIEWFRRRGDLLNIDAGGICRDRRGKPIRIKLGEYEAPRGRTKTRPSYAERLLRKINVKARDCASTGPRPTLGSAIGRQVDGRLGIWRRKGSVVESMPRVSIKSQ